MNKPNHPKTPISLAMAGLFFSGFNGAQADSYNEWGMWSGGGPANGGPDVDVDGVVLGGDDTDYDGTKTDDNFDQFERDALALLDQDDAPPNPFAFADPPTGTWDIYASKAYAGSSQFGATGAVATGTLALTPSSQGGGETGSDGVIIATLLDMENPGVTDTINAVGDGGVEAACEVCVFVGDAEDGTQYVGFNATEGVEGNIDSDDDPGDIADMADFFADGSIETSNNLIGEGGYFVAGQRTPSQDLQNMHVGDVQANYQGSGFAFEHSVAIDVDFGDATWNGNFTGGDIESDNFTGSHDFGASGGFNAQAQGVSNSITGDANAGTVIFSFFGPEAAKLGGNMDVSGPGNFDTTISVKDTFSAIKGGPVIPGGFVPPPDP